MPRTKFWVCAATVLLACIVGCSRKHKEQTYAETLVIYEAELREFERLFALPESINRRCDGELDQEIVSLIQRKSDEYNVRYEAAPDPASKRKVDEWWRGVTKESDDRKTAIEHRRQAELLAAREAIDEQTKMVSKAREERDKARVRDAE